MKRNVMMAVAGLAAGVGSAAAVTNVVDLGEEREAIGLRLESLPSRWHNNAPGEVTVWACEDAKGEKGLRKLAERRGMPPCFAGESQFVTWGRTKSRYWKVAMGGGGAESVLRSGYRWSTGLLNMVKKMFGLPHPGDASDTNGVKVARMEFFAEEPDDLPKPGAKTAKAYPESRLAKDWLMREFGVDGWHANRGKAKDEKWLAANRERRAKRLEELRGKFEKIIYIRRAYTIGGDAELHGTAVVSDEPVRGRPKNFAPGAQLCMLTIGEGGKITNEVLLETPKGMIRDPDLSHDGKTLVFAMRESFNENEYIRRCNDWRGFPWDFYTKLEGDDYHLYVMDMATRKVKQITFSDPARCADFEPCWTSDGKIIFQSSRCEQVIPCHKTMDVNLYSCEADGSKIRRLAIDGGCTSFPRELPDGLILYTRYEYNDRCARLQQPLFTMNTDGTAQLAFYGNASAFPTSLMHFRPIPGTKKLLGIVSGHHVHQQGKIAELEPDKGTEGDSGITFVAGSDILERGMVVKSAYADDPRITAEWNPHPLDFSTQIGAQWQYPYPLGEKEFLTSFIPEGQLTVKATPGPHFGVYWQTRDGDRELLAYDNAWECVQAVPVAARPKAFVRRRAPLDWSTAFGTFHIQNVYVGPGLEGVEKGTIKKLRVVAIESRPTFLYTCEMPSPCEPEFRKYIAYDHDVSGSAVTAGGAWDVKHVLGEVDVAEDGSCTFRCPAFNAVYFQLLDEKGRCVQTMRSWTHLQPGEVASCIGCHENRNQAYPAGLARTGMKVQELQPAPGQGEHPMLARLKAEGGLLASAANYLGVNAPRSTDPDAPTEGFSFPRLVQPILDRACVKCHDGKGENAKRPNLTGAHAKDFRGRSRRKFSEAYRALTKSGVQTKFCSWYSSTGRPAMLPPCAQGSTRSAVMEHFTEKHHGVKVTEEERRVVACWIDMSIPFVGSYCEATTWSDDDRKTYEYHQRKRAKFAEKEIEWIRASQEGK